MGIFSLTQFVLNKLFNGSFVFIFKIMNTCIIHGIFLWQKKSVNGIRMPGVPALSTVLMKLNNFVLYVHCIAILQPKFSYIKSTTVIHHVHSYLGG